MVEKVRLKILCWWCGLLWVVVGVLGVVGWCDVVRWLCGVVGWCGGLGWCSGVVWWCVGVV